MTAVSLINPYAPQPAAVPADSPVSYVQASPVTASDTNGGAGLASDQSGQGPGNGTGTGGAQLATLLKRGKAGMMVQLATPESVVEAQSESSTAMAYLDRQAEETARQQAAEQQEMEETQALRDREAKEAARPEYQMPNPLPTAPILKGDTEDD